MNPLHLFRKAIDRCDEPSPTGDWAWFVVAVAGATCLTGSATAQARVTSLAGPTSSLAGAIAPPPSTAAPAGPSAVSGAAEGDAGLQELFAIGPDAPPPGQFEAPESLAVSPDGAVLLADRTGHRIQRFTAKGELVDVWGGLGALPGQMAYPVAVAVAPNGDTIVAEAGNMRIQRFDPQDHLLGTWRIPRAACDPDEGCAPWGLAVSAGGEDIFLSVGPAPYGIVRLDGDLTRMERWGAPGSEPGQLLGARGIAAAADGTVLVADYANNRVQRFDADGQPLGGWGETGAGEGQFLGPFGVAIDAQGRTIVSDQGGGRLQVFAPDGAFVETWSGAAGQAGHLDRPSGVAVHPDGTIYVADTGNDRIQSFTSAGAPGSAWGGIVASDLLRRPRGLELAGGELRVVEGDGGGVARYTPDGALLGRWSPPDATFVEPTSVAEHAGVTYVSDLGAAAVFAFGADGTFLGPFAVVGEALTTPTGLAADPQGLLVGEASAGRVARVGYDGARVAVLGSGRLAWPMGIARDTEGDIFVADRDADRVRRFAANGTEVTGWPAAGFTPDQPVDVAVAADGSAFVVDANAVWALPPPPGAPVPYTAFGPLGGLLRPSGVAASDDRVYVSDTENDRIRVLGTAAPAAWRTEIFDNPFLAGPVRYTVESEAPRFDREGQGPFPNLPQAFSVRMRGQLRGAAGLNRLTLETAGGARLWIDGTLVIDDARGSGPYKRSVGGSGDAVSVILEIGFESDGFAALRLDPVGALTHVHLPRVYAEASP